MKKADVLEFDTMTGEWLKACEANARVSCLRQHLGRRRQVLFAASCCRLVWDRLQEPARKAVEASERYIDGFLTLQKLALRRDQVYECFIKNSAQAVTSGHSSAHAVAYAAQLSACSCSNTLTADVAVYASSAAIDAASGGRGGRRERECEQDKVFNSFLPKLVAGGCKTTLTVALARLTYLGEAEFTILLDALEDLGANVHEYRDTVFYKGNWLVDWLRAEESIAL